MAIETTNNIELKKVNRNRIYQLLYQTEKMAKQEIASALNMSLPTITQNLKALEEQNLIMEVGTFKSTGGRKPKAIAINPSAKFAVGLDITTNKVVAVVVDLSSKVVESTELRQTFSDSESYFQSIGVLVNDVLAKANVTREAVLGVGVALPAIISEDNQRVAHASILGLENGILGFKNGTSEHFERFTSFNCKLCNDANAGGIAEQWNKCDSTNSIYLSLNNTIGGAIMFNDALYTGENQRSGEFGHMTIVNNGRQCYCGKYGCADAYLSSSILTNSSNGSLSEFFSLVHDGSIHHVNLWNEYLDYLALTVNNLRMAFDCNVIIGGYVGVYMDDHIDHLRDLVAARNTYETYGGYIQACHYRMHATAVGAALLFIDSFIKNI